MDCLIIGPDDTNFKEYVNMAKAISTDSGAYRDLNLAFIEHAGNPYRALDIFTYLHSSVGPSKIFHNMDFLWPTILYLGTYLSKRGFSFDYVNLFHFEKEKLKRKLINDDILTIAITTTLYVAPHPIIEIVSFIRQYNSKVKIIVGGPYISTNAMITKSQVDIQRQFQYIGADIYVINAEGEYALVKILEALKNGKKLNRIENIAYKNGDNYIVTPSSKESNLLEENMVDYTLFSKKDIGEFVSLRTAKSCPFSCAFCAFPQRVGEYRYINVESVEKELNLIKDIGNITTLTFLDDTFNVPRQRFKEILRMMIKNQYGFKWNSFYRCSHGDEETISLMREAGCEGVFLGMETGSDRLLQKMNKKSRRKDYQQAIPLLKQVGITVHANIVIGFPGEDYETIRETLSLLDETKPDFFRPQLWYCDPMTPVWQKRDEYGLKGSAFSWSHNTMDSKTVADVIDEIFLSVDDPLWLPQNGFELWSVFYLQRYGMTISQVKQFIRSFNAVVRDQLIHPKKKYIEPDLFNCLKQSCQLDNRSTNPDKAVVVPSAEGYRAAKMFWLQEFSLKSPMSNIDITLDGKREKVTDQWKVVPCSVDSSVITRISSNCASHLSVIILSAYSILLSRLNGREDIVIAVKMDEGATDVVPLKLAVSWGVAFRSFLSSLKQKLQQALKYGQYAAYLLQNSSVPQKDVFYPPVLDVGYTFCVSADTLVLQEEIVSDLKLILEATENENRPALQFRYKTNIFSQELVKQMESYFSCILQDISENQNVLIEDISFEKESFDHYNGKFEENNDEVFNF